MDDPMNAAVNAARAVGSGILNLIQLIIGTVMLIGIAIAIFGYLKEHNATSPDDVTRKEAGTGAAVMLGQPGSDGSRMVFITTPEGKMRQCAADSAGHLAICAPPI